MDDRELAERLDTIKQQLINNDIMLRKLLDANGFIVNEQGLITAKPKK